MLESKAIVPYQPLTPSVWEMIESIAPTIWRAGLFKVGSKEAAAAIMLKGYELGLGLTSSFDFVQVIQGKPTLTPRGALALIQRSGELETLQINDLGDGNGPTRCRVTMKRVNGFEYTVEYSMDDAKRAGLVKPDSAWEKYPSNMLRWRAIGFCADVVFPDVIGGMKRADEFGADITPDGDVIEAGSFVVIESDNGEKGQAADLDLSDLVTLYGAEAIMQANDGKIPSTDQEVWAVAERLGSDD